MPFLKLCGRRWRFSTDDVVIPASFFLAQHVACLVTVVSALIFMSVEGVDGEAMGFLNLDISVICLSPLMLVQLGLLVFYIGLEAPLVVLSYRGTVVNFKPRESINNIIIARYGLGLVELIWTILAIIWANFCFEHCKSNVFRGVIIVNILCEAGTCVSLFTFLLLAYDPTGRQWLVLHQAAANTLLHQPDEESLTGVTTTADPSRRNKRHKKKHKALTLAEKDYREAWLMSFNTAFCCFCTRKPKDSNSMFGAVANVLCEEFQYLDLSSTDYIMALTLLNQVQRKYFAANKGKYYSGIEMSENIKAMDAKTDAAELKYIHTVLRLAMASGGWQAYQYENSSFSVGWTWSRYNCATCEVVSPTDDLECADSHICTDQIVRNDNSRYLSYASVIKMTNLQPHDIVYCNFRSAVFQTAFIIVVQPELRKVVISIRGTMSLEDVFTDLNAETAYIPIHQRNHAWKGHKGIIEAACYVRNRLIKGRMLERAFHVAQDHYAELGPFDLLLTGHSLGAGTAAILGILLKQDYPDLQVVCFSPPGGLLTLPAAEYTESFTKTIILGKDLIPRFVVDVEGLGDTFWSDELLFSINQDFIWYYEK